MRASELLCSESEPESERETVIETGAGAVTVGAVAWISKQEYLF